MCHALAASNDPKSLAGPQNLFCGVAAIRRMTPERTIETFVQHRTRLFIVNSL